MASKNLNESEEAVIRDMLGDSRAKLKLIQDYKEKLNEASRAEMLFIYKLRKELGE